MRYVILAQSAATASGLQAWLQAIGEKPFEPANAGCVVVEARLRERHLGIDAYQFVIEQIRGAVPTVSGIRGGVVILVDRISPVGLSAVSDTASWDHLVALLILTFPDFNWCFGVISGATQGFPSQDHRLTSLLTNAQRDPLLDPTGLREWVRKETNGHLRLMAPTALLSSAAGRVVNSLPVRQNREIAAAVDEEEDYATIHAYTAYRYGYRADIVTTWRLMHERFGAEPLASRRSEYILLMEDMRLTFADKPADVHLSRLGSDPERPGRDFYCPQLHANSDRSRWRLVITSGQMGLDTELVERNRKYLQEKRYGRGDIFFKPVGGICDLWSTTGLRTAPEHDKSDRGNAPEFVWPPDGSNVDLDGGHGAPGKLSMVACALIERANVAQQSATSASDWIRAALFASDAAELLSGKTPTQTVAALMLKHACEVRAECTFIGTGFHFGLDNRLTEIKAEVEGVCRWFEKKRRRAELDARAMIVNQLKLVFSELGRMEEEDRCLVELRWLNRLMIRPQGWRHFTIVHWLVWAALLYGEFLLANFARVVVMMAIWLLGLGYLLQRRAPPVSFEIGSNIVQWFFGGNAAQNQTADIHIISWLAVVAGVFHVGLLISYLYSLISRK